MLLAVSLIAAYILPTIGENWEDASIGAVVVMGIIGVMVLMVKWITTWEEKQLKYALWALGSMTIMLLAVSLIALYILPDISDRWDEVVTGGAIVLGIIGLMGLMVYTLGQMSEKTIAKGIATVAAIGALLWVLGEILPNYIDLTELIYENAKAVALGGLEIVATLGVWGLIFFALGSFVNGP
jgi:type III secretory pathway component EscS